MTSIRAFENAWKKFWEEAQHDSYFQNHPLFVKCQDPILIKDQVQALSSALTNAKYTNVIWEAFIPFGMELVVRMADNPKIYKQQDNHEFLLIQPETYRREIVAETMARLLPKMPQLLNIVKHFLVRGPCFLDYLLSPTQDIDRRRRIAWTAFHLVRFAHEFKTLWPWGTFYQLCFSADTFTRWYAARTTSRLLNMTATQSSSFFTKLRVQQDLENTSTACSTIQVEEYRLALENAMYATFIRNDTTPTDENKTSDEEPNREMPWHSSLVDVHGIILPVQKHPSEYEQLDPPAPLLATDSTKHNLRRLASALVTRRPVLVEGAAGSGKSCTIKELGRLLGVYDFVELHLDDQMDSKTLFGTYVCTDIPGEFVWQPGTLTRAIQEGRWVIIEDIERCPFEVLTALVPLLETRQITLPGQGEVIHAADSFQLFATRTIDRLHQDPPRGFQQSLWSRVSIKAMNWEEIHIFIKHMFSGIPASVRDQIMTTYKLVCDAQRNVFHLSDMEIESKESSAREAIQRLLARSDRKFTLRDLLKWCRRISQSNYITSQVLEDDAKTYLPEACRLNLLAEMFDTFCCWIGDKSKRVELIVQVGLLWDLTPDALRSHFQENRPCFKSTRTSVTVGRIELAPAQDLQVQETSTNFAITGHVLRLLERLAAGVKMTEPLLLVGETGCGKTTIIQHLATSMGQKLVVQNLNIQSDSTDLLGGYKPVDISQLARPLYITFIDLFNATFKKNKNAAFLNLVRQAYENQQWLKMIQGMTKAIEMAEAKFERAAAKATTPRSVGLRSKWTSFHVSVSKFNRQRDQVENSFAFAFVEGVLVKALREGHWVLLDEINLASADTLERLCSLLDDAQGSLSITERGDMDRIERHPNFRLFAAMNPPTDVGKKELPSSLRTRFTELFVDELTCASDLQVVVSGFLKDIPSAPIPEIVEFYLEARDLAVKILSDGARQKPRYSLRTLCQALGSCRFLLHRGYELKRALYEGFVMCFATQLEATSAAHMEKLIKKSFAAKLKSKELLKAPRNPSGIKRNRGSFVLVSSYWLTQGTLEPRDTAIQDPKTGRKKFVLTTSVQINLRNVARAAAIAKYPILLQGPTSAGKTSIVLYLAARIGQKCIRINNHEHTDIQEYLGSYVCNATGQLAFQEGILVEAVRNGWWVILDELNLAPSEVLEALNRLLDDNRELFIPETQEIIKPHPNFMLFATQNPPGLYGGRKVLSRAFRNRFLEIQVDEVPSHELQDILHERGALAPSYCKILVQVMQDLQRHRQQSSVFSGKGGFITTRDLLRWAERKPASKQTLAEAGYFLLAERLRRPEEKLVVQQTIEKYCGAQLNEQTMYSGQVRAESDQILDADGSILEEELWGTTEQFAKVQQMILSSEHKGNASGLRKIAVTQALRRLFTLVGRCLQHQEPVLLVGETGCGKTTVCQLYSLLLEQHLHIVNCHQHTETADLLGGLRPVRGKETIAADLSMQLKHLVADLPEATRSAVEAEFGKSIVKLEDLPTAKLVTLVDIVVRHAKVFMMEDDIEEDREEAVEAKVKSILEVKARFQRLFEWQDGPLISSMKEGDLILLDEINLAEDAVLERLNSVLEPSRTIVLAEKGGDHVEELVADPKWRIFATMNPGGDFGKRELSPALRNRFTEIWVPAIDNLEDLRVIIKDRIVSPVKSLDLKSFTTPMLEFVDWMRTAGTKITGSSSFQITLRDLLSWIDFIRATADEKTKDKLWTLYVNGAAMAALDGMGLSSSHSTRTAEELRQKAYSFLLEQVPREFLAEVRQSIGTPDQQDLKTMEHLGTSSDEFGISPFFIPRGSHSKSSASCPFSLNAPTTALNLFRVLRALQLSKPILLEGSPGVGKTSLITALAKASGHDLVRINLSEQTDIADLFGADLPVPSSDDDDESSAQFAWCDGVFLRALKAGSWVLLDELNLASQAVLEGLNSCLDHRGTVYIPEIDQTFECPSSFRVFGAQNPLRQGGGRKGLPKSFLNRFSRVYVDSLTTSDLISIGQTVHPKLSALLPQMIAFNAEIHADTMVNCFYGRTGSPWEFNLRDVFRWCELIEATDANPLDYVEMIYIQRMRTLNDRHEVGKRYCEFFKCSSADFERELTQEKTFHLTNDMLQIGKAFVTRLNGNDLHSQFNFPLVKHLLRPMETMLHCINMKWPCLLTGSSASGKTLAVRTLATLTGNHLDEMALSNGVDATELLGCFEQTAAKRQFDSIQGRLQEIVQLLYRNLLQDAAFDVSSSSISSIPLLTQLNSIEALITRVGSKTLEPEILQDYHQIFSQLTHFEQIDQQIRDELLELKHQVAKIEKAIEKGQVGCFEWIDGVLIKAMENGHWLLMDNVNFAGASVLDRLNAVLEKNGELLVNECGMVNGKLRVVHPHPNFRIFFAMDPEFGEISRALRNRCIEINLLPTETIDMASIVRSNGIQGNELIQVLTKTHFSTTSKFTLRHLANWSFELASQCQRGIPLPTALEDTFACVYGSPFPSEILPLEFSRTCQPGIFPNTTTFADFMQSPALAHRHLSIQLVEYLLLIHQQWQSSSRVDDINVEFMTMFKDLLNTRVDLVKLNSVFTSEMDNVLLAYAVQQFCVDGNGTLEEFHQRRSLLQQILEGLNVSDDKRTFAMEYYDFVVNFLTHSPWGNAFRSCWEKLGLKDSICLDVNRNRQAFEHSVSSRDVQHMESLLEILCHFLDRLYDEFQHAEHLKQIHSSSASSLAISSSVAAVKETERPAKKRKGNNTAITQSKSRYKFEDLSLIQQSHYLYAIENDRSKIQLPIIPLLYPLLEAFDEEFTRVLHQEFALKASIPFALILSLRNTRLNFFQACCQSLEKFNWTWFLLEWRAFQSAFSAIPSLHQATKFHTIVARFNELIQQSVGNYRALNGLWVNGGHAQVPTTLELWDLQHQLNKFTKCFDMQEALLNSQTEGVVKFDEFIKAIEVVSTTKDFQKQWIEAHCMLLYKNRQPFTTGGDQVQDPSLKLSEMVKMFAKQHQVNQQTYLEKDLAKVQLVVECEDEDENSTSKRIILATNEDPVVAKWIEFYLNPIYEHSLIQQELQVITCAFKVLTTFKNSSAHSQIRSLLLQIEAFFTNAMKHSMRSVKDWICYQDLLWFGHHFVQENDQQTDLSGKAQEQFLQVLKSHLQTMMLNFHRYLAVATFNKPGQVAKSIYHRSASQLAASNISSTSGFSKLLEPTQSNHIFNILNHLHSTNSSANPIAIADVEIFHSQLKKVLAHLQSHESKDNLQQLSLYQQQLFWFTLQCFDPSVAKDWQLNGGHAITAANLRELKEQSTDEAFKQCCDEYYEKWIDLVFKKPLSIETLGESFIIGGLVRFQLLVPASAIDPALEPFYQVQTMQHEIACVSLHTSTEKATGKLQLLNAVARDTSFVEKIVTRMEQLAQQAIQRPSTARPFIQLYQQFRRFHQSFLQPERIHLLLGQFQTPSSSELHQQIRIWEQTIDGFQHQVRQPYAAEYLDIIEPLMVAIEQIKNGLMLLAAFHQSRQSEKSLVQDLQMRLMSYPCPYSRPSTLTQLSLYLEQNPQLPPNVKSNCLTAGFAMIQMHELEQQKLNKRGIEMEYYYNCKRLFDQCIEFWSCERLKQQKAQQEREQTIQYKLRTVEIPDEETLVEREYKLQFPDYKQQFQSALGEATAPLDPVEEEEEEIGLDFQDELIAEICTVHHLLYNDPSGGVPDRIAKQLQLIEIGTNLTSIDSRLRSSFEQQTWNGAIFSTKKALENLEEKDLERELPRHYNFHKDPNLAEAICLNQPLHEILQALGKLIKQWPENEVLQRLLSLTNELRKCSICSSIAQLLSGVELLLLKLEEWEQVASRGVSLREHITKLMKLITRWRKLELQAWPQLLDVKEHSYIMKAQRSWFHLYTLLCSSGDNREEERASIPEQFEWLYLEDHTQWLVNSSTRESSKWLRDLFESLDQFIRSCNSGEFPTRLDLLFSFCKQLHGERESKSTRKTSFQLQLQNLLYHLYRFYHQHLSTFTKQWQLLRQPIQLKLKQHAQISKWDEQSYYALAESTEKSHRQLFKHLRSYDDVLQLQIQGLIDSAVDDQVSKNPSAMTQTKVQLQQTQDYDASLSVECCTFKYPKYEFTAIPAAVEVAFNCEKLNKKINKYLVHSIFTQANQQVFENGAQECESLCETIFYRLEQFQSPTARKKLPKGAKQKALSDLLKEFQSQGFLAYRSNGIKCSSILQTQLEQLFTLSIPSVPSYLQHESNREKKHSRWLWERADGYYYKQLSQLFAFQHTIQSGYNKDISASQVERMHAFSEHWLDLLLQQRQILDATCINQHQFVQLHQQLQNIEKYSHLRASSRSSHDLFSFFQQQYEAFQVLLTLITQVQEFDPQYHDIQAELQTRWQQLDTVYFENAVASVEDLRLPLKPTTSELESPGLDKGKKKVSKAPDTHSVSFVKKAMTEIEFPFPAAIERMLQANVEYFRTLLSHFSTISTTPSLERAIATITKKLHQLVEHQISPAETCSSQEDAHELGEFTKLYNQAIEQILKSIQSTIEILNAKSREEADDNPILDSHQDFVQMFKQLRLAKLHILLTELLAATSSRTADQVVLNLRPLLTQLQDLASQVLAYYLNFHKSFSKFTYINLRLFRTLLAHGFCRAQDEEDEDDANDAEDGQTNFEDDVEGTGMGEGEGKKDVSDQIEDEEQLLGLQSDQQDPDQPENKQDQEKGLEMENEFEGQLQDLPDDQEDDDKLDEEKEEEEEELDREMGDFDEDDENVVDEKMWGDDSDDDDNDINKEEEKFEKDSKMEGPANDDEIRTKEEDEENEENSKDEKPQTSEDVRENQPPPQEDEEEGGDQEEEEDTENGKDDFVNEDTEDKYEENHHQNPQPEPSEDQELPDNLEFDQEEDEDTEEGQETEDRNEQDEEELPSEQQEDEDQFNNIDPDQTLEEDENEQDTPEEIVDAMDTGGGGDGMEDEAPEPEEDKPVPMEEDEEEEKDTSTATDDRPAAMGTQSKDGTDNLEVEADQEKEDEGTEEAMEEDQSNENEPENQDSGQKQQSSGGDGQYQPLEEDSHEQNEQTPEQQKQRHQQRQQQPNPYRNIGDAEKQWRRRMEIVQDQDPETDKDDGMDTEEQQDQDPNYDGAVEFINKDDQDESTLQTLAPSEVVPEETLVHDDEDQEEVEQEHQQDPKPEENEPEENISNEFPQDEDTPPQKNPPKSLKHAEPKHADSSAEDQMEQDTQDEKKKDSYKPEEAEFHEDQVDNPALLPSIVTNVSETQPDHVDTVEEDEALLLSDEEIQALRQDLDEAIATWSSANTREALEQSEALWSKYVSLTSEASQRLCEQLRLVLEPTLKAKLQGDYRTGKRINMRKVIPYIASQFRKDKIWLRRTKPSKRQYQVMIAIDDSESMKDNAAGRLALEALTILCKSMSQLEVGDLAVVKFGETIELVHPFEQPFTDEAGGRIVSQFHFDQAKTHLVLAIDTMSRILQESKQHNTGSSVEFTQLVFLISDARFDQDGRLKIQRLVREAAEKRQLFVLVIVDQQASTDSSNSIEQTQIVKFVNGKVVMTPYLENFPFPYYILLQQTHLLPETLADALRQWFELIQQQN